MTYIILLVLYISPKKIHRNAILIVHCLYTQYTKLGKRNRNREGPAVKVILFEKMMMDRAFHCFTENDYFMPLRERSEREEDKDGHGGLKTVLVSTFLTLRTKKILKTSESRFYERVPNY